MTELEKISQDPISRRQFLARMTAAGLGAAAVAMLAGCSGGSNGGSSNSSNNNGGGGSGGSNAAFRLPNGAIIPGTGDIQVVNYALALETTEADIYRQALNLATSTTANPVAITAPLRTGGPSAYPSTYPGSTQGTLTSANANVAYLYLAEYAYVEAAHRDLLLSITPGGHADTPGQPTTTNTSNPVLNAAGYQFVPTNADGTGAGSLSNIMRLILAAEETGVTAYLGAVPFISSLTNAQLAAAIYSTEARHSAGVRYVLGNDIGPGNLTAPGTAPTTAFVSGSAHPSSTPSSAPADEFEFALAPASVLSMVVSTFYQGGVVATSVRK